MTRWLSEALQAPEPFFRQALQRLEAANQHPNTDIRFSTQVRHSTQAKLRELGLDPRDTTTRELYQVLQSRVKIDDQRLVARLRTRAALHVSTEGKVTDGMVHVLQEVTQGQQAWSLKTSKLRSLLKATPPKKAMKQLGYRSLDSFLKHEQPATALAAAWLTEGSAWQKRFLDQYKKLKASDFESRPIAIVQPTGKGWQKLAQQTVADSKHNLLSFKELGTLILLPFADTMPAGSATVSLALALHELNEIRASSTFLKLGQVRKDFGHLVQMVATDEPRLSSELLDQPVPWHLIQRFYARLTGQFRSEIFEPHIESSDMSWQAVEEVLSQIEPSFSFWHDSAHLALMDGQHADPVSLNVIDAALNYCNQLNFEQRLSHFFRRSLWHELLLQYLRHDTVEQTVLAELQPALAEESIEV